MSGFNGNLRRAKAALKKLDRVNEVESDYLHDNVLVEYDSAKLSPAAPKKVIQEVGSG